MRLILAFLLFASTMLLPGTGKAAPLAAKGRAAPAPAAKGAKTAASAAKGGVPPTKGNRAPVDLAPSCIRMLGALHAALTP